MNAVYIVMNTPVGIILMEINVEITHYISNFVFGVDLIRYFINILCEVIYRRMCSINYSN